MVVAVRRSPNRHQPVNCGRKISTFKLRLSRALLHYDFAEHSIHVVQRAMVGERAGDIERHAEARDAGRKLGPPGCVFGCRLQKSRIYAATRRSVSKTTG